MAQTEKGPLQAYVFMHELAGGEPREVLGRFAALEGVRYAAQFVGSFIGFGAVEVADLRQLHRLMADGAWKAGVRCEWSVVVKPGVRAAPKRGSPPYCALVRADTVGDPRAVLDSLDAYAEERFPPNDNGFRYASAVVNGRGFDLLVEFGSTSLEELYRLILEELRPREGIGSTDSAFAYLPDNELRSD